VNKTPHVRDSHAAVLGNSERLRLPRAQFVLMFICVALFSALAAFVATALSAFAEPQTVRWYAIFVFPGWFTFELFSRYQQHTSARNGELEFWIIFAGNFTYYFVRIAWNQFHMGILTVSYPTEDHLSTTSSIIDLRTNCASAGAMRRAGRPHACV
jgi:hypothetical protein